MLNQYQSAFSLTARILLAALFLPAGLSKLFGFAGTVGYIASVGLPLPTLGAVLAVALEVLGGLALIAGYQTRWSALLADETQLRLSHGQDAEVLVFDLCA